MFLHCILCISLPKSQCHKARCLVALCRRDVRQGPWRTSTPWRTSISRFFHVFLTLCKSPIINDVINKLADYVSLVISMVLHFTSYTYLATNRTLKIRCDVRKGNIIVHGDVREGMPVMCVKVPNCISVTYPGTLRYVPWYVTIRTLVRYGTYCR